MDGPRSGWDVELLLRSNNSILVIKKDGEVRGSLTFDTEDLKGIEKWTNLVRNLSKS